MSLISLISGVSFVNPLAYILQALQYLLIFSKTSLNIKVSDEKLGKAGFFQLQVFLGTSDYVWNVLIMDIFIGAIGLMLVVAALLE